MSILVNDYKLELISHGVMLEGSEVRSIRLNVCRKCIVGTQINNFANIAPNIVIQKMTETWSEIQEGDVLLGRVLLHTNK